MSDYIYALGPNGSPVRFSGAARPPEGMEIISEEVALKQWNEIEAADWIEIAAAQEARRVLLADAYASLTQGLALTSEEAMALGARPLSEN